MRPIRRILVAVKDPMSRSFPAVTKAAQLAKAFRAELELFHAISTPLYIDGYSRGPGLPEIERNTRARYIQRLEQIATKLRVQGIAVSVSAEWDYPVHEAIVRRAQHVKAGLIVAQRHAGRHVVPRLLQLTDWELLRMSPVPVLLVKSGRAYRRPVLLAAIDPGHTFSKPAGLDSEILKASFTFGAALRGAVHAVHAYIPIGALPYTTVSPDAIDKLEAQAAVEAKRRFDKALTRTRILPKNRHLVPRHPIDAIEQTARETHSAIVVMGAISRSGLKRMLIGNTAEGVLDHLESDLLILKPRNVAPRIQGRRRGVQIAVPAMQGLY